MTKAELLTKLAGQVVKVLEPIPGKDGNPWVEEVENIRTYDYPVLRAVSNGTWTKDIQPIYVVDEGKPTEQASFSRKESANETVSADGPFLTAVRQKIANTEGKAGVLRIVLDNLNEQKKFALVTAYVLASGTVTASKRFVVEESGTLNIYNYAEV